MTDSFPGLRLVQGDTVQLVTDATSVTITGAITSKGVLLDGRGFVELTLPDADPQQRRDLERSQRYWYQLYRGGALIYSSPHLTLSETRRTGDGSLVVTGAP
ncbi:hypothetical protein NRF20_00110 (plasmid) [Streptomyces sp. R-74717]|uniref:hypothetical protein n=1 Tax=Streptomyces sp. R-74717 TaxID=2969820 RepID=UPI0039B6A105